MLIRIINTFMPSSTHYRATAEHESPLRRELRPYSATLAQCGLVTTRRFHHDVLLH